MVAKVLVEIRAKAVDRFFDYSVPLMFEGNIKVGKRVLVPFGRQTLVGFVVFLTNNSTFDGTLKDIIEVIDEDIIINDELMKIGEYISKKTLSTKISALQTMLPRALKAKHSLKINKKYVTYLKLVDQNYEGKNDKQKYLVETLKKGDLLKDDLKPYLSSIKTLIKNGIICEYKEEQYRLNNRFSQSDKLIKLNKDQQKAVERVKESQNVFKPFLLYGVTGSGKTEVYMHMISNVIKQGKSAIVLVPEISLTPQFIDTFNQRFGNDIAILHSKLSDGEKYDEWRKIVRGEVHIAIGARSAIFAPFNNLGIIILDEEHTVTYKQDTNPRYHAIDIALFRGKYNNIPVVLGSATPSLESYTRAKMGIYELLKLSKRINNNLPEVQLVDMAKQIKKGYRIISQDLLLKIKDTLENKEQVILLLNRRGYATTVSCHACGYKVTCPNCDIPLTYHKRNNVMKCHYCDYTTSKPLTCPSCGSTDINQYGLGTEKLEEEIAKLIPDAKVVRMDIDTTTKKGSHRRIFEDFKNKKYDILVGTQMIAKGLDFENVTLVGVINGDASLNVPDFRSAERTFELLNQVSGRAGRGSKKGYVIIQGFNLTHYSIIKAKNHDYEGFYNEEMKVRKILNYPPYFNLSTIKISGTDYDNCLKEGEKIADYIKKNVNHVTVLGPSNYFMPKINNQFYIQITLKYKKSPDLFKALKFINQKYAALKIKVEIDINQLK